MPKPLSELHKQFPRARGNYKLPGEELYGQILQDFEEEFDLISSSLTNISLSEKEISFGLISCKGIFTIQLKSDKNHDRYIEKNKNIYAIFLDGCLINFNKFKSLIYNPEKKIIEDFFSNLDNGNYKFHNFLSEDLTFDRYKKLSKIILSPENCKTVQDGFLSTLPSKDILKYFFNLFSKSEVDFQNILDEIKNDLENSPSENPRNEVKNFELFMDLLNNHFESTEQNQTYPHPTYPHPTHSSAPHSSDSEVISNFIKLFSANSFDFLYWAQDNDFEKLLSTEYDGHNIYSLGSNLKYFIIYSLGSNLKYFISDLLESELLSSLKDSLKDELFDENNLKNELVNEIKDKFADHIIDLREDIIFTIKGKLETELPNDIIEDIMGT